MEARQGDRDFARRGQLDQAELRDRRRAQHAGTRACAPRRADHAGGHGADQQWLGDPRQRQRHPPDTTLPMNGDVARLAITTADDAALKNAVKYLEGRNFAAKLADYAGVPVNRVLGFLPKSVNRQISGMVRNAVMKGLAVAV